MAPILASFAAASAKAYGFMQSGKASLIDLFARSTSGSLGGFWTAVRGTWFANGSQAQSNDAASNYSLASANLSSNNMTVSASVGGGGGVGFWVSDANNWWAAAYTNTSSSYSCNCQTCSQANTCTVTDCASCGSYKRCNSGFLCMGNGACCVGFNTVIGSPVTVCNTCSVTSSALCGSSSFSCNCQTCTDVYHYLRLSRAVSGTITTSVVSDVALSQAAAAVRVVTVGDSITARAFSDNNFASVIGTISTTPSSPIKAARAGIIKVPSSHTQSSTIDNFAAEG